MTKSSQLEVSAIHLLRERTFRGLRVSVTGEDITARRLLTGDHAGEPLVAVAGQLGPVTDLVGTYWAGVYLVSERFRRSVENLGVTGQFTTPVEVEGVQSSLWLLSISGRCGPVFGVGGEPLPGGPPLGQFIDPGGWDGSDFFMADNNNSIFASGSTAARVDALRLSTLPSRQQVWSRSRRVDALPSVGSRPRMAA
jgi:hypothetical protein